jgi:hypothetical protein
MKKESAAASRRTLSPVRAPLTPAGVLRLNPDQSGRKAELSSRLHFAFMKCYNEIRGYRVLEVIQLHPNREPIGQFIQIGRGYTQLDALDALLGAGRLRLDRAVFNAGAVEPRRDLLHTPQAKHGGFGLPARVLARARDRQLTREQSDAMIAALGGRKAIASSDVDCCPRGLPDMWQNPKAHYLYQRRMPLQNLSTVPNRRRAQHFIDVEPVAAERKARALARLKISDYKKTTLVAKESARIERFSSILGDLLPRSRTSTPSPTQRAHR